MHDQKQYCAYCARVAHRCVCAKPDSRLQQFLAIIHAPYQPILLNKPYKRGVPPQIKRRERATMRSNYRRWYAELVTTYSERCMHCSASENLVVDHVLSIAKGGRSELNNLQLLCASCNNAKGKLIIDCRP